MKVVHTIEAARESRADHHGSFGLVPTMGALHDGHISLVQRARRENAQVGVSVFVNPTQFGRGEDLDRYPRDLDRDRRLLDDAGCDLLFAPDASEMYPEGYATTIDVGPVSKPLEGERRSGHFQGVATVVQKLLAIFRPDRAYFGEKDAQQLAVIQQLVRDLDVDVEIVPCPIVREPDGLAMSSRNAYLSHEERRAATVLYRALSAAQAECRHGEADGDALCRLARDVIAAEPRAEIDYVALADPRSFEPVHRVDRRARLLLAVRFGNTRLIDNVLLG